MSDQEQRAWNSRYADGSYVARTEPSSLLVEWLPRIPTGRALDVACGPGRHALHMAEAGFVVDAVDISDVAVAEGRAEAAARGIESINWFVADLDHGVLPGDAYDLITVLRYRNEGLWAALRNALAPDGWIVIEHHLQTSLDVGGPTNPDFRLKPAELLEAFSGARILYYSELLEPGDMEGHERFAIARMVACVGDPGY